MEFTQLKTLIHVAELGSLSRAADRLKVAQPALSRQIRLLEAELGITLFDRHGRGMRLTDAGEDVLAHAASVMTEIDTIREIATSGSTRLSGAVVVGMPPTITEIATVPLVRRLRQQHPDLRVRFSSAFSGHVLDWLQRGEIDVSISYDPEAQRSLRVVPVMVERLLYFRAGGSVPLERGAIDFAAMAENELILPSPRHGLRILLESCARRAGVTLKADIEVESLSAIIDLVRAGYGGTILPLAPLSHLVESGVLAAAHITDPEPSRKVVVAYPADRRVSAAARAVGTIFMDLASDFIAKGVWSGEIIEQGAKT